MNDGKDKLKIWQFFTFKLNLTLKWKVNYTQNNRDLNQGVSSLNGWQVIARTSKVLPHTRTHRQTDAANDNTLRPKLASGKNDIDTTKHPLWLTEAEMTYICICNLTSISSDDGLSPGRQNGGHFVSASMC